MIKQVILDKLAKFCPNQNLESLENYYKEMHISVAAGVTALFEALRSGNATERTYLLAINQITYPLETMKIKNSPVNTLEPFLALMKELKEDVTNAAVELFKESPLPKSNSF
jgi:hypothetical protein